MQGDGPLEPFVPGVKTAIDEVTNHHWQFFQRFCLRGHLRIVTDGHKPIIVLLDLEKQLFHVKKSSKNANYGKHRVMDNNLFSSSLETRLAATKAMGSPAWKSCPLGLRGAANAVLIFLGPSFGKEDEGQPRLKGGFENRPTGDYICLGKGLGLFPFGEKGSRVGRWKDFMLQCCGSSDIPEYLTALFNLDWSNEPDESKLQIVNLQRGADLILPFVEAARPRVVVALTNRVHDEFLSSLKRNDYTYREIPSCLTRPAYEVCKPDGENRWLFVKTQNHPSRSFFGRKSRQAFGDFVKPFLLG